MDARGAAAKTEGSTYFDFQELKWELERELEMELALVFITTSLVCLRRNPNFKLVSIELPECLCFCARQSGLE